MAFKRKKRIDFGANHWLYVALQESALTQKISMGKLIRTILINHYKTPKPDPAKFYESN